MYSGYPDLPPFSTLFLLLPYFFCLPKWMGLLLDVHSSQGCKRTVSNPVQLSPPPLQSVTLLICQSAILQQKSRLLNAWLAVQNPAGSFSRCKCPASKVGDLQSREKSYSITLLTGYSLIRLQLAQGNCTNLLLNTIQWIFSTCMGLLHVFLHLSVGWLWIHLLQKVWLGTVLLVVYFSLLFQVHQFIVQVAAFDKFGIYMYGL